jgi:D-aminopeptidase
MRARELDFLFPGLPTGPLNAITDVPGVLVGQVTLHDDDGPNPPIHTGVTAIIPAPGDLFHEKLPAAVHTINGFGKAAGFEQIREMGTLETPIALTNTLCVGRAWDALVTWMLERYPDIGAGGPSVNPLVMECNDSRLNDLRGRHVQPEHVLEALAQAQGGPVAEGAVGAGSGMMCYGFKGGVGTASRQVGEHLLGGLLVSNFGRRDQLIIRGKPVGKLLNQKEAPVPPAAGSVVIVLATDAPLSDRQLGRIARRGAAGLARTGSTIGSGSGDFVLAFSTSGRIPHPAPASTIALEILPEAALDRFFDAAVEVVEEAVLNSLCQATPVRGPKGYRARVLPVDQVAKFLV